MINLNIWERFVSADTVSAQEGNAGVMRQCIAILNVLELTADERKEIDFAVHDGMATWREVDKNYDLALADEQQKLLKSWLEARTWRAPDARRAVALIDKL